MPAPTVGAREHWLAARKALLEEEKAYTRAGDVLAEKRRALPWVKVETDYRFQGEEGETSLADLFDGRGQLIVQHFMFGPDWDAGCPSCSFWADGFDNMVAHMNRRTVSFVAVSRGPLEKLLGYRARMGWSFPWVSSPGADFNEDFNVSPTPEETEANEMFYNFRMAPIFGQELHGVSVFAKGDDGSVFHTYSTYGRGLDRMNAMYGYMDLTPKGRNEDGLDFTMAWLKRHDEY